MVSQPSISLSWLIFPLLCTTLYFPAPTKKRLAIHQIHISCQSSCWDNHRMVFICRQTLVSWRPRQCGIAGLEEFFLVSQKGKHRYGSTIFLSMILLRKYIRNQIKISINNVQLKNRLRYSQSKHHTEVNENVISTWKLPWTCYQNWTLIISTILRPALKKLLLLCIILYYKTTIVPHNHIILLN